MYQRILCTIGTHSALILVHIRARPGRQHISFLACLCFTSYPLLSLWSLIPSYFIPSQEKQILQVCDCIWIRYTTFYGHTDFSKEILFEVELSHVPPSHRIKKYWTQMLQLQWLSIENQQSRIDSDVSFILTIFPKNFWNKWYLILKP